MTGISDLLAEAERVPGASGTSAGLGGDRFRISYQFPELAPPEADQEPGDGDQRSSWGQLASGSASAGAVESEGLRAGRVKGDQAFHNGTDEVSSAETRSGFSQPGGAWSLTTDPRAKALMTTAIQPLVEPMEAIIQERVIESGIDLERMEWTVFKYKDQKRTDLILRIFVRANRQQALAFWEHLGERVDEWVGRLDTSSANLLIERLSIEVLWA
jgi:hypothetical protein